MKLSSKIILTIQSLLLFIFSLNIYYEITNYSNIENWYVKILVEDFSDVKADEVFYRLRHIGYKVDSHKIKKTGEEIITLSPPHDQGLVALFYNRFFFNYIIYIDSKSFVYRYGLNK